MFYCNRCAELNNWPQTGFKSYGECEICRHFRDCNDMPSSSLPMPLDDKEAIHRQTAPVAIPNTLQIIF